MEYLKQISCFDSSRIIDMDGNHFNPKDYAEKFGWADVGGKKRMRRITYNLRHRSFQMSQYCDQIDNFHDWDCL